MLKKELGFWQGLALYLAAVLGTGILTIPSMAWNEAGPGSLIAWAILGLTGFALAWSFAAVGATNPNAGGIQSMISRVFGKRVGDLASWIVLFAFPAGSVAGSYIFAAYFVATFQLSEAWSPWVAWGALALAAAINFFGLKVSANAQLTMSFLLVALLTVIVFFSFPHLEAKHFSPFLPNGSGSIGRAAVLIFWSFFGWEAVAHLAEEFKQPRDMFRAAWVAGVLVAVLYLFVAFVLIGTGAVSDNGGLDKAPMATLAKHLFGEKAGFLTGLLASLICFGTINAYMAGISRLGYAMARDGVLPSYLSVLHSGTPRRSIAFLLFMQSLTLLIQAGFGLPIRWFFLALNVSFMLLYTLGCLATSRLLSSNRVISVVSFLIAIVCGVTALFAYEVLWYPLLVVLLALVYFKKYPPPSASMPMRN